MSALALPFSTYQVAVRELHGETQHEVAEYLEREWQVTELLMEEYLPSALDGDTRAFDCVMKLLERRAKYRGLDAPTKVDARLTGKPERRVLSREEMKARIMAKLADFGKVGPPADHVKPGDEGNGTSKQ